MSSEKPKYRRIIAKLPEFGKAVRFKMNIVNYAMAEAGGACDFVRKYTLASGGPYCDCGYRKKT